MEIIVGEGVESVKRQLWSGEGQVTGVSLEVVLFDSFLGKNLPPSLSVPLQSMATEIWFIKQSPAPRQPQLRRTHTRCSQETGARLSLTLSEPPSTPFSPPCLSTPFWVQVGK